MLFSFRTFALQLIISLLLIPSTIVAQVPAPPDAQAPARPTSEMRRAVEWRRFEYTCKSGDKVTVFLHANTVKIRFKDQSYLMKQVASADGAKYSDGKMLWWSVGDGGVLQEDTEDGQGTTLAKDCKLENPPSPAAAQSKVTGTVSYLVRMALPPEAVIEVQLLDVSVADAPSKVVAEQTITLGGRQVPVPFSLDFDPAKIQQNHTYLVSGRILVGGQPRFISDKTYSVITHGNPMTVELILNLAGTAAPATQ